MYNISSILKFISQHVLDNYSLYSIHADLLKGNETSVNDTVPQVGNIYIYVDTKPYTYSTFCTKFQFNSTHITKFC